jgi:tetratricopeptide (TPR) repeat protein
MAINKRKVLDAARKHVQKGARAKAFKEYGKLLAADPQDAKLLLEVGDTYRRWGEVEEAITHYTKVASLHRGEGYDARAIAVLKQIINLDPMRHTVRVALAELYQQIGLAAEAVSSLQQVADVYAKEGRQRESLDLLRKMAAVDPRNVKARVKVAELLDKAGHNPEAVEEYREAAVEFSRLGEVRSVVEMYERVLALSPKHVPTLTAVAKELCGLGEAGRAEPYALRALEEQVKAEHYELLCEVYEQMGDEARLSEMTQGLASLYRERGDEERAREVMQRAPMGADLNWGELEGETDVDSLVVDPESPAQSDSVDEGGDAAPSEHSLEQADVHLGYGQYDEAVAYLEGFLIESPTNFYALEKLGEAQAGRGDEAAASECWQKAEALARDAGDHDAAAGFVLRLKELSPAATSSEDRVEFGDEFEIEIGTDSDDGFTSDDSDDSDGSGSPNSFEFGSADEDESAISESASLESDGSEEVAIDLEGAFESESALVDESPDGEKGVSADNLLERIDEDLEEAEFYLQQSMTEEAEAIYRRVLEADPEHVTAREKLAELEAGASRSAPGQGVAPAQEQASEPAPEPEHDLEFDLDADSEADLETDFDSELELDFDIGTDTEASAAKSESPPRVVSDDLEIDSEFEIEIEIEDASPDESAPSAGPGSEIEFGDVAPAPATQAATVEEGVAELFADFKQGVSETLEKGDYQTRFDLGIAYREMELLEDAIAEFRYCLDSPDWRLQSLQMIGLSNLDLGRAADAVSHFEQALSAPDLSDAQKSGLYFDFGRAQAALGDTDPAHDSFARVRAIEPDFFGLAEAIASLPPRTPGTEPVEEEYESFDDLMAEFNQDDSSK